MRNGLVLLLRPLFLRRLSYKENIMIEDGKSTFLSTAFSRYLNPLSTPELIDVRRVCESSVIWKLRNR